MAETKLRMNCPDCDIRCASFGKHRNGLRRFRCAQCGKTYTEPHQNPLGSMTSRWKRPFSRLGCFWKGQRAKRGATTELHLDTIMKLLVVAGEKCEKIMGRYIRNVTVQDVECDEVWSFIGKKEKRIATDEDQNLGDAYTFVAIERNTKLVLKSPWASGTKDHKHFIEGLRDAIAPGSVSDHHGRFRAVQDRHTGHLRRLRGLRHADQGLPRHDRRRSPIQPAEVKSVEVVPVCGNPDPDRICTSIIERSNLSLRMGCRRFTRLTNAFSRKWENHWAAVTFWYTYYNFCRIHKVPPRDACDG